MLDPLPEPPASIRAKTRDALYTMVMDSRTAAECAREAGLGVNTLSKAMAKQEVRDYVTALKAWKDKRDTIQREGYLALAMDEALRLAQGAKSESVRMRAIEFLHDALAPKDSTGKPQPLVHLTQNIAPGYQYDRPADVPSAAIDHETPTE
jgi:hypothetical protein